MERWADEDAATHCGDRRHVARTIGKAALATKNTPTRSRSTAAVLGIFGRRGPLRTAGPVPRRVAALLAPPLPARTLPPAATALVLAVSALCVAEAAHDLHLLLELAGS
ncbi:hypothetical protein [Streptomyces sp. NPDC051173]|uniref:hypothetical protein n=1 Tax=Streptomyces sp. NPDC051173 TaxID=3155164 RepID=UPI0034510AAC